MAPDEHPLARDEEHQALVTTIVDVARAAGVSTATVSRVLNGKDRVDPQLAATVTRVAKELGYRPNRVARSLRMRHNHVWALVISDIRTGQFFADVVRGVEDGAYEAGYSMFLCNSDEDPSKEARYIGLAVAENVAGVILVPSGPDTDLGPLLDAGIHVVLADRSLPGQPVDSVVGDNVAGGRQAVEHLVSNGYRRVACITGPPAVTTGSDRLLGYRATLEQAGLTVDPALVRYGDFREKGGRAAMQALLALDPPPDAVFICNNTMAAGALQAIEEAGLEVPRDIALVGYDEILWAPLLRSALTTVSQPAYDLGHESARLLINRIDGYSGSPRRVTLPTTLNVRASSAPKAGAAHGPGLDGRPSRSGTRARVATSRKFSNNARHR